MTKPDNEIILEHQLTAANATIKQLELDITEKRNDALDAVNQIEVEFLGVIQEYFGDGYNIKQNSLDRAHKNIKTIRKALGEKQ